MRVYWVYVLWSEAGGRFYIGVAEDVDKRLAQHNQGVSRWTRRYAGTWRVVWKQEHRSLSEARRMENWLKKQRGGGGFFRITRLDCEEYKWWRRQLEGSGS